MKQFKVEGVKGVWDEVKKDEGKKWKSGEVEKVI